jgi:hypothetical protein
MIVDAQRMQLSNFMDVSHHVRANWWHQMKFMCNQPRQGALSSVMGLHLAYLR